MGRFGTNVIVFVLNNEGYLVERALEENPNWTYNDLAPWKYAELPKALGCAGWFTARVTTLGELEHAMKSAGPQGSLWSRSDGHRSAARAPPQTARRRVKTSQASCADQNFPSRLRLPV